MFSIEVYYSQLLSLAQKFNTFHGGLASMWSQGNFWKKKPQWFFTFLWQLSVHFLSCYLAGWPLAFQSTLQETKYSICSVSHMVKSIIVINFSRCIRVHLILFITRGGKKKELQHFYGYLSHPLNARIVTWLCWILGCGGGRSPLLWQAPDHISVRLMSSCTRELHHKRYIPPDHIDSLYLYSVTVSDVET